MADDLTARLQPLRLMAFDVDGVLTDGRLYFSDDGAEIKSFHTLDGQGMTMLRDAGIKLALITSRRSTLVERRARDLGVHYCYQGVAAKTRHPGRKSSANSSCCRPRPATWATTCSTWAP